MLRFFFPLFYTVMMLVLLFLPPDFLSFFEASVPKDVSGIQFDHLVHLTLFSGLSALWVLAGVTWQRMLLISLVLAASSEFLQGLTGRHPSVEDFLANVIGVLIGLGLAFIAKPILRNSILMR